MHLIDSLLSYQVSLAQAFPESHKQLLEQRWRELVTLSGQESIPESASGHEPFVDPKANSDGCLVYFTIEDTRGPMSELMLQEDRTDRGFDGGWFNEDAQCYELIRVTSNSYAWHYIIPKTTAFNRTTHPWLEDVLQTTEFG